MKCVYLLLLITVLFCFALCDDRHHLNKKKHDKHKVHKSKFIPVAKHRLGKAKRVSATIEVNVDNVQVLGNDNETLTGKRYFLFQGIAYAKPPVGELRFEPPQPYTWEGTYDATYQRNICARSTFPNGLGTLGSEDCLYLNIYTTSISPNSSLSVLVWIYGGGFIAGDGNYETFPTDNFIDQDLVTVTINYRLGAFGFLSTGDNVVPGNMGLKDQVLALQWVQKNIEYFGGNPKNVTIMGESAGGVSVAYLVQSPTTRGLFQRAIAHSGNSLCPWSLSRTAANNAILLGANNLIFTRNTTELVQRLKEVDYKILSITSVLSMSPFLANDVLNGLVYAPVIEPPNPTPFFSTKSYEQLASCNLTSVPILLGYNSEEGRGTAAMLGIFKFYLIGYDLQPDRLVPTDMNISNTTIKNTLGNEIKQTYWGNSSLLFNDTAVDKFFTDDQFIRPTIKYAELSSRCGQNVFLYRFSYTTNGTGGVSHTEELQYFFNNKNLTSERDRQFSKNVVKIWSNFIKRGNPTPDSNEFNVTWYPTSQANNYSYLDVGRQFVNYNQSTNPDRFYLDNWTKWYGTYGNRPYDTY